MLFPSLLLLLASTQPPIDECDEQADYEAAKDELTSAEEFADANFARDVVDKDKRTEAVEGLHYARLTLARGYFYLEGHDDWNPNSPGATRSSKKRYGRLGSPRGVASEARRNGLLSSSFLVYYASEQSTNDD